MTNQINQLPPPPPDGIIVYLYAGKVFNLTPSITVYADSHPHDREINEKDSNFPFTITPAASFKGHWESSLGNYYFTAKPTSPLKPNTTYTVTIKTNVPNYRIEGKSFSFTTPGTSSTSSQITGWQEKKQFIIPIELEMPEEVLPAVKNIKVSLLID